MRRLRAALLSSPLRERQDARVLVVIWLHCYPLCREFGVHSYPLPLHLPRFSPPRTYTRTHTYVLMPYSLFPFSKLCLVLSESLFLVSRLLFSFDTCTGIRIRNVHHFVQLPTLLLVPAILGPVKSRLLCILWNYIFSLDFTFGENMPVRSPAIFASERALSSLLRFYLSPFFYCFSR